MQSQGSIEQSSYKESLKNWSNTQWEKLSSPQKLLAKKAWGILTYKWRWQIAMNVPYLVIFLLDRTVPSVHKFDMAILNSLTSHLPIPAFISSWLGIG